MKGIEDQKEVWNRIAPDWYKFKDKANPDNLEFVKKAKGRLLDIGCAAGRHFVKTGAEVTAIDFSPEMIKHAKRKAKRVGVQKIKFAIADASDLPFEDGSFDYVLCIAVLHCIEGKAKRLKALKEISRVLKKGGKAKISVWNKDSSRFKKKKKEDFVGWRDKGKRYYYFYDEEEFLELLKSVGFKVLEKKVGVNVDVIVEKN